MSSQPTLEAGVARPGMTRTTGIHLLGSLGERFYLYEYTVLFLLANGYYRKFTMTFGL